MSAESDYPGKMEYLRNQGLNLLTTRGIYEGSDQVVLFIAGKGRARRHITHLQGHIQRLFCNSCSKKFTKNDVEVNCTGMDPKRAAWRLTSLNANRKLSLNEWGDMIRKFPCKPHMRVDD